jgi:hypothetical protein
MTLHRKQHPECNTAIQKRGTKATVKHEHGVLNADGFETVMCVSELTVLFIIVAASRTFMITAE